MQINHILETFSNFLFLKKKKQTKKTKNKKTKQKEKQNKKKLSQKKKIKTKCQIHYWKINVKKIFSKNFFPMRKEIIYEGN